MSHTLTLKKSKYDRFTLKVELIGPYPSGGYGPDDYLITQSIWVNSRNIAPKNPIDWHALVKSCQLSGEYFIFTCGCGCAACAGIEDGISVTHLDDEIVWEIPDPLSIDHQDMSNAEYEEARQYQKFKKFIFEPNAYLSEVQKGLRVARSYLFGEHQPVECSPYGIEPKDILAYDSIALITR